ncbi:photoreceptor outer segment membrane glycoprotein 2-like [Pollicipes pollicipes]|uniref:photoreceptor outer segment membrane glycoprotein 2-like n=1 Tax=Pollicipes pollicipes TaxID=41117 RepID=UPI001884C134|nr:photoreceptor outer segment membrane glycoprotein 2-like [Pollicipes pollicipes]
MPVCQIPLRERSRGTLGIALMTVNCIIAGMAHVVLFLGIYIRVELGGKAQLLKNYNPDVLFHMMLSISATLIIFHAPGAKICYDCGNWKTRDRFHACFLFWLIAALLVSFVPVSALILCAIHKGLIETAFVAGFNEAAVRYKLDLETKAQLDRLQVGHQCCGAKGFDDWTRISWVNMDDVKPSRTFTKSSSCL